MKDARVAGLLFAAAFLVRFVSYLGTFVFGTDGGQFLFMADWMRDGRFNEALSVTYHPLYPFLVAVARGAAPSTAEAGFWVSMVLGAGATVPLFLVVRSIFGRPAAFVTVLIYAFHPSVVELQSDVMTEGTFAFFLFWTVWLTWSVIETPSVERSLLLGLVSVCAYLTRPEGVLAVALALFWPSAMIVLGKREKVGMRLGGSAACVVMMLLAASPYLFWVRSVTGRWALSAKESVAAAETRLPSQPSAGAGEIGSKEQRYVKMGKSILRMTYLVGVPFYLLGLFSFRRVPWRGGLFFFSFPLGYLAGVAWTLQKLPYLSYRYVIPPMNLLAVVEALGVLVVIQFMARRWPERRWVPSAQALVGLLTVAVGAHAFSAHRVNEKALLDAALWIRGQGIPSPRIFTSYDKVAYLAGAKLPVFYPEDWEGFLRETKLKPADFYVYLDKDQQQGSPPYLDRIEALCPEVTVFRREDQPGAYTVYVRSVRRKEAR